MKLKVGVHIVGIQPCMVLAMSICDDIFQAHGQTMTVTSCLEGGHKSGSRHYDGLAFDLRIHDLRGVSPYAIAQEIQEALGSEFLVIPEATHIHVEVN